MKPQSSRPFALQLVALIVTGAVGLLAPTPAQADQALFRVERKFFGAPFPSIKTPMTPMGVDVYGGAGRFENYIEPFTMATTPTSTWPRRLPAGVATVDPMNPVGAKFTLPRSFIDYQTTVKAYASTAFPGYTSFSYVTYVNGEGRFRPNNPYGATTTTRVVFPTTMGNPTPNLGAGNPVTPTTTFGGRYDFSRAGSIFVEPGPNRFGGTMRFLYAPTSLFYQYIFVNSPLFFKAYGSFKCERMGITCTEGFETNVGETTSSGMVTRFLLTPAMNAKATTMGTAMDYVVSKNYYLHLLAPWTTGKATVYNPLSTYLISPGLQGFDKAYAGVAQTITRTYTTASYMGGKVNYSYMTTKQYLDNVTRVVSLVRPRITQTYQRPRIPSDPIFTNFQAARNWTMNVFFLPEPGALLMLGAAVAGLAGLSLLRRR
jgi:hypothetical protein